MNQPESNLPQRLNKDDENDNSAEHLKGENDVIREFADLARQEISIRSREIDFKEKTLEAQERIALTGIQAQKEDRTHTRDFIRQDRKNLRLTAVISLGMICVFVVIMALIGKPEIAKDVVAAIIALAGTAFGSYMYGKQSKEKKQSEDNEQTKQ